MPSTVLKCGKATKFNAHSLPQIPQCHLASSFNVTDEPPIAVSKLLNLAVHWPSKVWPVGMIARKRRECLKFNTPLNVSFQKSTKVFPYYSISVINSTFFYPSLRWTLCSPFWKSLMRDVTSYWQADWTTHFLEDTFPLPVSRGSFVSPLVS